MTQGGRCRNSLDQIMLDAPTISAFKGRLQDDS